MEKKLKGNDNFIGGNKLSVVAPNYVFKLNYFFFPLLSFVKTTRLDMVSGNKTRSATYYTTVQDQIK